MAGRMMDDKRNLRQRIKSEEKEYRQGYYSAGDLALSYAQILTDYILELEERIEKLEAERQEE